MFDFGCAARNEGGVAGRNNKGLMTIDRKTKKDSYFVYQAYWSKQPMVHIAGRRHAQRAGETTEIKAVSYTHLDVYKRQVQEFGNGAACSLVAALIIGGVTGLYLILAKRLDAVTGE